MQRTLPGTVAGQKVQVLVLLGALCGALPLGAGCARKAPGPDECVAFAKVWVERRGTAMNPGLAAADPFDELVRDCLTKPYDRALVECVIQGGAPSVCRTEYRRRVERSLDEGSR